MGRAPDGGFGRPRLAWTQTTQTFPANVVASLRLANQSAVQLGWQWRWMLSADDDCIVSPSHELSRALRGLRARAPWYLGTPDSMWWRTHGRGPELSSAAVTSLGSAATIVQPEDELNLQLRGEQRPRRVMAEVVFPACTFPEVVATASHTLTGGCIPHPLAQANRGCRWSLVASSCRELWSQDSALQSPVLAPYGYGLPMTACDLWLSNPMPWPPLGVSPLIATGARDGSVRERDARLARHARSGWGRRVGGVRAGDA